MFTFNSTLHSKSCISKCRIFIGLRIYRSVARSNAENVTEEMNFLALIGTKWCKTLSESLVSFFVYLVTTNKTEKDGKILKTLLHEKRFSVTKFLP